MNRGTLNMEQKASLPQPTASALFSLGARQWQGWLVPLVLINLGLLLGNVPAINLAFDSAAVAAGEWWRLLSWPLVHVSRYHLLLDGAAFLLLYSGLEERRPARRLLLFAGCALGSLLLPLALAPQIHQLGLCGLSGVAHGLAAISALEMLRHRSQQAVGWILLGSLLLKVAWELATGTVFLQQLHLGDIGQPIVATHAGGALGGLLSYWLFVNRRREGFSSVLWPRHRRGADR